MARILLILSMFCALTASAARAESQASFILATTTSTENSGLLEAIIPQFTEKTGVRVSVVAVGTGQALAMGRRGDAAALLTHDRVGEDAFVAAGYGADRRDAMYNDFVIAGPATDPAGVSRTSTTAGALARLHDSGAVFVSRGDDSGTHRKELRLWAEAGFDPEAFGAWYREAGSGMGQTLLTTVEMEGYTMSDRATWVKFNRKDGYVIVFEEDPPLNNPYSSIIVTNDAIPAAAADGARQWHEWLTSEEGRAAIAAYRVDGQQLFFIAKDAANG